METYKELNINTDWSFIINLINKKEFSQKYKDYIAYPRMNGFFIKYNNKTNENINEKNNKKKDEAFNEKADEKNEFKDIFLFEQQKEIIIFCDNTIFASFKVFTSLEIETYIKSKSKDINDLYIRGYENAKYLECKQNLGLILENTELELIEKKALPKLELEPALSMDEDYTPKQYSPFFYDYFIYEDKQKENEKIVFQNNEMRSIIFHNITIKLRCLKNFKTFKFTGPSSIGKSFTLFRLSHICYNIAYINLKVLFNKSKTNLFETYSIIISEIKRFNLDYNLEDIQMIINKNYTENKSYLDLLLDLMEYLNKIQITFVFIFDQFKSKYVNNNLMNKIKEFDNIKIVQCSSINDKEIREECLTAWLFKGKNVLKLDEYNQDFYFYFEQLYFFKREINNLPNNIVFRQFDFLPKYIEKYKDYDDKNAIYRDAKKYIEEKIDKFCESYNLEKSLLYANLNQIINKNFDYGKFNKFIKYCPLEYFKIKFDAYEFKILPIFPFMLNIINYEYTESECYNYFKNEIYKRDLIINNLIKEDFFKASVKFGLRKLNLPDKKDYLDLTLYEIVSMDEIIYNKKEYFIEKK